jgi:hypothetical protein
LELNANIGAYEILHPLTKNENFSAYKQGFMNFTLMTAVLSDSETCHERVFVVHILLVNLCEQAYEYVFNENSTFQMVGSTRSTSNGFDASGSGDLPPPPPMTPMETFMATQTEVLHQILQTQQQIAQQMQQRPPMGANHDGPQMVTTYSQFIGMKPQLSLKQESPLMLMHGLGPLRPNFLHLSYLLPRSARLASQPCIFVEKL